MLVSREKLAERMYSKYKNLLGMDDCRDLADDILQACEQNSAFMIPLKEFPITRQIY